LTAYYNEFEPYAAEWLRNLIKKGLIADGIVDDRSITSVEASDLGDFTQCHFFAGIGVWSHALRLAGWPDDRPVWTGSCPCQPFSAAGKGAGFADERHLWPEFYRLIAECRPPVVFGEQVASKDGLAWLDTVHADMEASGYAIGAADLCAAGVGAPHIRQRLWFVGVAHAENGDGWSGECGAQAGTGEDGVGRRRSAGGRIDGGLADTIGGGQPGPGGGGGAQGQRTSERGLQSGLVGLEHTSSLRWERGQASAPGHDDDGPAPGRQEGEHGAGLTSSHRLHQDGARPTNGHWRDADWLHCRDGKWRPVEPGTFPLAHGAPARVGRLRAYGNAIVGQAAKEIIAAYMECRP
jgi:DNA (cytosine-5)-methyltransferase 1